jgi:hypothetical protein
MANTNAPSGGFSADIQLLNTFGGDTSGQRIASCDFEKAFTSGPATSPDIQIAGWLKGTIVADSVADTLEFAHPTDPFRDVGDAEYSDKFNPAGKKLMQLVLFNKSSTETVRVTVPASGGLSIASAGASFDLKPLSLYTLCVPAGFTAALVNGAGGNDKLTVVTLAGTAEVDVVAVYIP